MRIIKLTQKYEALIDAEDYALLCQFKWRYSGGYAKRGGDSIAHGCVEMGRELLQPLMSLLVDHRNGNKLDNRRQNLRLCTQTQNHQNRKKCKGKYLSDYMGVASRINPNGTLFWQAYITYNGKSRYIGQYRTEFEAARARDKALIELKLTFYKLNFPEEIHHVE